MKWKFNGEYISILSKLEEYYVRLVDDTALEFMNLNYTGKDTIKIGYFIPVNTECLKLFGK